MGNAARFEEGLEHADLGPVCVQDDGWAVKRYRFLPDFLGFSGHFPSFPILPAMIQVLIARNTAEELRGHPLHLLRMDKAKFRMRIAPGRDVEVLCREIALGEAETVCFEALLRLPEGVAASFTLTFAAGRTGG